MRLVQVTPFGLVAVFPTNPTATSTVPLHATLVADVVLQAVPLRLVWLVHVIPSGLVAVLPLSPTATN